MTDPHHLMQESQYRVESMRRYAAQRDLVALALANRPPRRPLRHVLMIVGRGLVALGQRLQGHEPAPARRPVRSI